MRSSNGCTPSSRSSTPRSKTCAPESGDAVREAAGGRHSRLRAPARGATVAGGLLPAAPESEVLDAYIFGSMADVRAETARWLTDYNTERPHDSLGRVPPLTFLPRSTSVPESTN